MFAAQLFAPVGEEKFLFTKVHELLPLLASQDGAEGGAHLERDQKEHPAPDHKMSRVGHAEGPTGTKDQCQAQTGADDPQGQEKKSEEGDRGA